MSSNTDPRKTPSAIVHTKAVYITSAPECQRQFGAAWKAKLVPGKVIGSIVRTPKVKKLTYVLANWLLPSGTCRKEVALRNVKEGSPPLQDSDGNIAPHGRPLSVSFPSSPASSSTGADTPRTQAASSRNEEACASGNTINQTLVPVLPIAPQILANGKEWNKVERVVNLNGTLWPKEWEVKGQGGIAVSYGSEWRPRKLIEYFMMMFPMEHLTKIVQLTSDKLEADEEARTTGGEILKFLGVLILMTRFEFGSTRRNLWATKRASKYVPSPNFGAAMSRRRFDAIFKCISFSEQPMRSDMMSSTEHRWSLVSDFLEAINEHRLRRVVPSETICVDESIVRWYGLGGHWIDKGLPRYVAIDRKPEAGCEIQNAACARSGIILRMELVTTAEDERQREYEQECNHGTAVIRRLLRPWACSRRHVLADSYFASVETAAHLAKMGLSFTGVVKTATSRFPMQYLSNLEMPGRGAHAVLEAPLTEQWVLGKNVMAVAWVDRNRRYFVSTTGSTTAGAPYVRQRWRQGDNGAERVEVTVEQPDVVQKYYDGCAAIDRHNRCRQDDLGLEKKVEVKDWHKRVNFSLFAVCVVDAWLLYKGGRGSMQLLPPHTFYEKLAEQLIDNNYDGGMRGRDACVSSDSEGGSSTPSSGRNEHLSPTKRRRLQNGKATKAIAQNRCAGCAKYKSKFLCSECRDTVNKEVFFCHSQTGRNCYSKHLSEVHYHN